jgi:hypothetical protein
MARPSKLCPPAPYVPCEKLTLKIGQSQIYKYHFGMQIISVSSSYKIGIIGSSMKPRCWCPTATVASAKSTGMMSDFPRITHPESKPLIRSATSSYASWSRCIKRRKTQSISKVPHQPLSRMSPNN